MAQAGEADEQIAELAQAVQLACAEGTEKAGAKNCASNAAATMLTANPAAAYYEVILIKHTGLARSDGALRFE